MSLTNERAFELRRLRELAAVSQFDLAVELDLGVNDVSLLERGRKPLDDELYERCKQALVKITGQRHQATLAATQK